MKKTFVTAAAIACALQPSVALATDAAVCTDLGSGQTSVGLRPSATSFMMQALLLNDNNIMISVLPINGSCFGNFMGYKSTRGATSIYYDLMGNCGTNGFASQLWLNKTQGNNPSGTRLYPGITQADGSIVYIGRVFVTSPTPLTAYDFKLLYKSPSNFTAACTAKVDATGVSALWNGK